MTGAAGSTQQLTLMLDWFPNADHVGIYQALAEGDFTKAGLDVHVEVPSDPADPLKLLATGKVDAAISYEPEVLLARNQGLPLVSVAAIVQEPLTSIVSIGSKHITDPAAAARQARRRRRDPVPARLPGRRSWPVPACRASSVKEINVGDNLVPAMLSGRVDATLGAYWNYEAIQLAQLHKHPNVIHMEAVGVPTYDELVVVVTQERRSSTTPTWSAGSCRRWRAATSPSGATRRRPSANLVHASPGTGSEAPAGQRRAPPCRRSSRATPADALGLAGPQRSGTPTGSGCSSNHLISDPNAVLDASTNELLAGQGSDRRRVSRDR